MYNSILVPIDLSETAYKTKNERRERKKAARRNGEFQYCWKLMEKFD